MWIGTSGWVYPYWRGVFYPPKMPIARWLPYYADHFPTVELNNSFYRLPSEQAFAQWRDQTPPGFRFAVKASRYLTHMKKLRDVQEPLALFLSRARQLGPKLGPILYQLPPFWNVDLDRLRDFLALLPRDVQHVMEFRNATWLKEEVFALLEKAGVGLCIVSLPNYPLVLRATASFVYLRMHGSEVLYSSSYQETELQWWAERMESYLAEGREVYVYFNNDAFGYAVQNAFRLHEILTERGHVTVKSSSPYST